MLLNMSALQEIVSRQLDMRRNELKHAEEILAKQLTAFEGHFRKWVFTRFVKASVLGTTDTSKMSGHCLKDLFKQVNPEKQENVCSLLASVNQVYNLQPAEQAK